MNTAIGNAQFGGITYSIGEASICSKCGKLKPRAAFFSSPLYLSGHDPRCQSCYVGHGRHDYPGKL